MRRAIELSVENVRQSRGGPFGCVIVKDDRILAEGSNLVTSTNDPTAHGEIVAIRAACAALKNFQLEGCDLYTSCEPCPMCLGAIYWSRLAAIYFGCTHREAARFGFDDSLLYQQVRLPMERRQIPMRQLLSDEALEGFREWDRSGNKIPY